MKNKYIIFEKIIYIIDILIFWLSNLFFWLLFSIYIIFKNIIKICIYKKK